MANARCLAEGVDVPALDGVACRPTSFFGFDIVQAVGRALRKSPDKTVGTVVLPVFIDQMSDAEQALDSSAFKPVWDVLRAMRAHGSRPWPRNSTPLDANWAEGRRVCPSCPSAFRQLPGECGRGFRHGLRGPAR